MSSSAQPAASGGVFAESDPSRGRLAGLVPVSPAVLITFSSAAVGAGLGRALLTSYLPVLLERIRDAPGLIGTVMLVNTLAGFFVPLLVGVWSDRLRAGGHGRTIPFVFGGSVLAAGGLVAVALGNASSYLLLALFAAVTYTGLNAITTGHRALIPENFNPDQRAAATGGEELAMLLGTLIGVAAGGALIELEGWAPFALGALLLPLLAWPTVLRMRGRERLRIERERRAHRGPGYYLRAAARPGGRLILGAQGLWVLGYVGLPPFFILYADHELNMGPGTAGILLAGFGILTGLAMLAAGTVREKRERPLLLAGAAAMGVGLFGVAASSHLGLVLLALLPVAAGFGLLTTLGFPAFSAFIPRGEEGAYSALYFSVRSVASAIALPAAGWTIALTGSYRALFVFGGCATLAALVPLIALPSPDRPRKRVLRSLREKFPRQDFPARRWALFIGLMIVVSLATLGLGLLVQKTEALLEVDRELFQIFDRLGPSPQWLDPILVDPHIQNYAALISIAALGAWRWLPGRVLRTAATVSAAALVAYAMVRLPWLLWERPRPEEVLGIAPANGHQFRDIPSFPSGHVAVTTAIAASTSALLPKLRIPLWAYAVVIAVTRLTFGAHFPSDVAAAFVLGALAGWGTVATVEGWRLEPLPERLRALFTTEHGERALRRVALALSIVALAVFTLLLATVGAPVSPDGGVVGADLERNLQTAMLVLAAVGVVAAWFRDPLGGLLLIAGIGLGVLAALEYTPLFAFFAFGAFALPGTLFLLAWPWARRPRHLAAVLAAVALAMGIGGVGALAAYDASYGPSHPQSPLDPPPTWRVQWIWSGAVTDQSARVTARLNSDADARLLVGPSADLKGAPATPAQEADDDENDRLLTFTVDGLRPGTRYYYGVEVDGRLDENRIGTFRTFASGPQSFKLAFAGCARVGSNGAVFDAIREEHPDLYLILGDMFYANIEVDAPGLFRDQFDRSLGAPAQGALYRSAPIAYVWDDHDFGGNGSDSTAEARPAARSTYRSAVPHYDLPAGADGAIYQAFTVGRVRFIVMDTRSERVPGRTMLGAEQLAWVKRELASAGKRYPMTVLVSSVPWIDKPEPGAETWGGFADERAELSRFIAEHRIPGLLMLSADAHMLAIDDGSHSDYSGTGAAGFPVAQSAALDRPGSVKGGPYSEGTFPGGGQYSTLTVVDRGDRLRLTVVGKDYSGREIVRYAYSLPDRR